MGNLMKKKLIFILYLFSFSLVSHSSEDWPKPEDRLKGLADKSNFVLDSGIIFENTKTKKLAIIKSVNVDKFLAINDKFRDNTKKDDSIFGQIFLGFLVAGVAITNPVGLTELVSEMNTSSKIKPVSEDTKIASNEVLSTERMVSTLVGILKGNFGEVAISNDIPSAVENKNDYIVILDLSFKRDGRMDGNFLSHMFNVTDGNIITHSVTLSALFFDQNLNVIEDILVTESESYKSVVEDTPEAEKIIDTLTQTKAREKSLAKLSELLASKVK